MKRHLFLTSLVIVTLLVFSCSRPAKEETKSSPQSKSQTISASPSPSPLLDTSSLGNATNEASNQPPTVLSPESKSDLPALASNEPLSPEQLYLMQNKASSDAVVPASPTPTPELLQQLADELTATPTPSPTEEPLFTEEDLQELRAESAQGAPVANNITPSNRIAGVRRTPTTTTTSSGPTLFIDQGKKPSEGSAGEISELPFVAGQSRGYTLLNLMQPEARSSINEMIEVMVRSNVRDLYLGVLVDGTFHWDPKFLRSVIRKLNTGERRLFLVLYLSSGPTMRRYATTPITAAFSQIEPEHFRRLIRWDQEIRQRFAGIASRVRPIASLNNTLNPDNRTVAIVMLEDNLDRESYWASRALAKSVLGATVEFYRNPCLGCYPGNDGDSQGDPIEIHDPAQMPPSTNTWGLSLDGKGFHHSFEPADGSLSFADTKKAIRRSIEYGAEFFGLWRIDRQGLHQGANIHPHEREYAIPTAQQKNAEAELLRYGLKEVGSLGEQG